MITLLIPHQVCLLPFRDNVSFVLIFFFPTFPAFNTTNSTTSGSGKSPTNGGSGNAKNGALRDAATNICGLTVAVVLGVLAITL